MKIIETYNEIIKYILTCYSSKPDSPFALTQEEALYKIKEVSFKYTEDICAVKVLGESDRFEYFVSKNYPQFYTKNDNLQS